MDFEDCGFGGKLLEAQRKMTADMGHIYDLLLPYGFDRGEISSMTKQKIKAHADAMNRILFSSE